MRPARAWLALAALAGCGGGTGVARSPDTDMAAPPAAAPAAGAGGALAAVRAAARPIAGGAADYADLLAAAAPARRILLGESTHGTHEYYRERGRISERLVIDQGAQAIAIEGDWSPTYRLNRYVRSLGADTSAGQALGGYTRFPEWMWPNTAFRDFVERLRAINLTRPAEQRVGLYGMDVYDLFDAADFVVGALRQIDSAAAGRAAAHYRCFARYNRDTGAYGEATRSPARQCDDEAAAVTAEVARLPRPPGAEAAERHFALVRAAASVAQAEEYFRTAYTGTNSWNARDRSMERNVEAIAAHGEALTGRPGKVIMWAHNSHVGDARATAAANRGELNLGQLMRERHGEAALLVGFFTQGGTVLAAPEWGAQGRVYTVRPARAGSHADLFHRTGLPAFSLLLRGNRAIGSQLSTAMQQRAIGVIYVPESELQAHYFDAILPRQFDAAIFFAQSKAVTPLRR